ncbi:MAG: ribonuclease P protein component [Bacteroidetes bacterium]|nr:MAG: ribonuclease P protein component [Bacteroidota bacterium]
MNSTFPKNERLCRNKLIRQLFETGASAAAPPLRVRYLFVPLPGSSPVQLLIAVPKSFFPKASDRNLIRRRIRESYRRNKYPLHESLASTNKQLAVALSYTGKQILPYAAIEEKIILLLQRLMKENEKASG